MTLEELIAAVPIREFRGRPFYVRICDIPPPWDAQFSRALYGANCPGFPDEGPCAHSHDWQNWVNGHSWGGANAPTGLEPHGLSDLAAIALKSNGKLSPETLEQFGHQFTKEILTLVENTASGCKRPRR
jgi:hypothetical protein